MIGIDDKMGENPLELMSFISGLFKSLTVRMSDSNNRQTVHQLSQNTLCGNTFSHRCVLDWTDGVLLKYICNVYGPVFAKIVQ